MGDGYSSLRSEIFLHLDQGPPVLRLPVWVLFGGGHLSIKGLTTDSAQQRDDFKVQSRRCRFREGSKKGSAAIKVNWKKC